MTNKNDTNNSKLLVLAELVDMDVHTSKIIGFAEIYKVDVSTFTIRSIDHDQFVDSIGKDFTNELPITDDSKES